MTSYKDEWYKQTKQMLLEGRALDAPLAKLADWIGEQYDVAPPANIRIVVIDPLEVTARLNVVLRDSADTQVFRRANKVDHDSAKAKAIIAKLRELAAGTKLEKLAAHDLFAVFTSFEETARWEANAAIPPDQLERIEKSLSARGIWKVYPIFDRVTFFFHTDDQVRASLDNGDREACEEVYAKALKPYDRFGFFARSPVHASFDSKESFDRDYDGSWFAYTR